MIDKIAKFIAAEPLVILGFLASVATAVQEATDASGHVQWQTVIPVVIALILRQFVTSPKTAADLRARIAELEAGASAVASAARNVNVTVAGVSSEKVADVAQTVADAAAAVDPAPPAS